MGAGRRQRIEELLLGILPPDGAGVGNGSLLQQLQQAGAAAGLNVSESDFQRAREALLGAGLVVKGRGRGGSTARATQTEPATEDDTRPAFELQGEVVPTELPFDPPKAKKHAAPPRAASAPGDPQVLSYRHAQRRVNNPEVGLVNEASDPERPRTKWAYDPHLDPVLNFDTARAKAAKVIEDALQGDDPAAMRSALEELRRMGSPYLQWAGKAERTSFEVDTVSLHVHERIDPMSILAAVSRAKGQGGKKGSGAIQPGLFEAPFESLPLRDAVDFYRHDKGWSNRLIAGDSLLVMNSLLMKEGMAGQVQMIYIDPPYGIKYGSNFQPFVNKRDVKDRTDADLTQEPEMIKAFRDTWELGIHSYLTYLRDRLLLARELLADTGSVFVQISDENVHHVREMLDEVFTPENFIALVTVQKTTSSTNPHLSGVADYLVWYAKAKERTKYRELYRMKQVDGAGAEHYKIAQLPSGQRVPIAQLDQNATAPSFSTLRRLTAADLQSAAVGRDKGEGAACWFPVEHNGVTYLPNEKNRWKTNEDGVRRAVRAGRVVGQASALRYARFLDDFGAFSLHNVWTDFGGAPDRRYVVETNAAVIERCLLLTTDAGDLVLDPTCGSGTTAVVAEKWGRRWITCDTSRVAVTLAKQRLMTASFDYFELRYPHEGLKGGFIYKTVPHVTLRSIANNPEIDSIYERLHPAIEAALATLNASLRTHCAGVPFAVAEGARKGQSLMLGANGVELREWEVPFPADDGMLPAGWPELLREPFEAYHSARQRMQAAMDASIAAQAESETLYDQPEKSKNKLRITGPFSVEAVPFPAVLNLDATATSQTGADFTADAAVARSGATSRHAQWRDELLKTGIRGKAGQMLRFTQLDTLAGTNCLHCTGQLDTGEPAVVSFGPEHGALDQRQVEHAIGEAGELFPRPKIIVFCAFTFDPEAAKDIDAFKGITALKAQMNTDLLTEDLKKARSSNQSFWLMGQPDVLLRKAKGGTWQVEVNGFDYFDTVRGELMSGGKAKIAMWSLDTDYDGRSLFPHQVFFPMAGSGEGWGKLKKDIRAELDEDKLKAFQGTVSLPFEAGTHKRVAVKIVDDRGIESLKVLLLAD